MRSRWRHTLLSLSCLLLLPATFVSAEEESEKDMPLLKVCADPFMLPYSNKEGEGLENRIADLFAEKLGAKVQYAWFPQRMGFIRNTLRANDERTGQCCKCDLVITVPSGFELAATTDTYYTSYYVLIYVRGRGLDEVTEPEMLVEAYKNNKDIPKIGLSDMGPAQLWVYEQDLMGYMTPYQSQLGNARENHVQILIRDLIDGKIGSTIVWGPMAAYFANLYRDEADIVMLRMKDDPIEPSMKFQFSMAMGVRHGEGEWKEQVNQLLKDNKEEIRQILLDYNIPLVE